MSEENERTGPGGHRTPMDEQTKLLIRETLARPDIDYNIGACATLLGMPPQTIHTFVDRDPALAARCPGKNPEKLVPGELDILDRETPADANGILMPREQAAMIKGLIKQNDRVIKKGWRDLGLSEEDARAMEEAEKRAALPIGRVMAASEGHLILLLARSAQMLDRVGDQLVKGVKSEHGPLPRITDIAGSDKTEIEYLKAFQNGAMVHVNIQQTLLKGRAATIDAMKKLKDMQAEANRPAKGVFDATQNAEPDHKR